MAIQSPGAMRHTGSKKDPACAARDAAGPKTHILPGNVDVKD